MTRPPFAHEEQEFILVRGADNSIDFTMYEDSDMLVVKDITLDEIYFNARTKWDRALLIFQLSTIAGDIDKFDPVNGGFRLLFDVSIMNIDPGCYGYDIDLVDGVSGLLLTARVNAFDITSDYG